MKYCVVNQVKSENWMGAAIVFFSAKFPRDAHTAADQQSSWVVHAIGIDLDHVLGHEADLL